METNIEDLFAISTTLSDPEKELITKAFHFSKKAHEGQERKNGDPYFTHVFETAKNIARLNMDAKTIAAGLLHDVLEDTEITEEEMQKEFGEEIVSLVNGVTKLGKLKYRGQERHVESLRKFFIAIANDLRVVIIKFSDRLHNLSTLEHVREDKRKRIAIESIEVYAPLANRLCMGKLKGDIEDAAFPFAYPKEYALVDNLLNEKNGSYEENLSKVHQKLEEELDKNKIFYSEIDHRVKHKYSLYKKLQQNDMDIEKIFDIVALRVVTDSVENCYRILGLVHSIWKPLPGRIKDYIAVPKPNGYRSIHTTIFTGNGGIAEIQIRTKEMHIEADYGVAAHFAYKEKNTKDQKSKFEWIEELKDLKDVIQEPQKFIDHLKMDFFNDRIFIFTPKGDVVDLPNDSCPIDFAYAIHSDIGDHVSSAKINGKIAPIHSKLKNGDMVEIIIKKDSHPSGKWLDYVKTTLAKKNIKQYTEKNSLLERLKSFSRFS